MWMVITLTDFFFVSFSTLFLVLSCMRPARRSCAVYNGLRHPTILWLPGVSLFHMGHHSVYGSYQRHVQICKATAYISLIICWRSIVDFKLFNIVFFMSYVQALFMLGALLIAMSMQLDRKGLWNLLGPVLCAILFMVTAWVSMVSQWQPSIIYTYPSLLLSIARSNIVCIFHNQTILGWASSDQLHVINYTPTLFADICLWRNRKRYMIISLLTVACYMMAPG